MEIIEANESHADIVGRIHSDAWKDTYRKIFSPEYIESHNIKTRKQEFLEALEDRKSKYYLIQVGAIPAGIAKISLNSKKECKIESIYLLKECRGRGFGTKAIEFLKKEYQNYIIKLWVLEQNQSAISFYKKIGFILTGNKRTIMRGQEYEQIQFVI